MSEKFLKGLFNFAYQRWLGQAADHVAPGSLLGLGPPQASLWPPWGSDTSGFEEFGQHSTHQCLSWSNLCLQDLSRVSWKGSCAAGETALLKLMKYLKILLNAEFWLQLEMCFAFTVR